MPPRRTREIFTLTDLQLLKRALQLMDIEATTRYTANIQAKEPHAKAYLAAELADVELMRRKLSWLQRQRVTYDKHMASLGEEPLAVLCHNLTTRATEIVRGHLEGCECPVCKNLPPIKEY